MKLLASFIALFLLSFSLVQPVSAQGVQETLRLQRELAEINRIKPLQNKTFIPSNDILNRRILDDQNKVVGELEDAIISTNGRIQSLLVSFDRLRLRNSVFIDYNRLGVGSVSDGYRLGLRDEKIEELYPELLADIQTAAGEDDQFSITRMINSTVVNDRGQRLGKVTHVLFDEDARTVIGYHFNVNYRTIRNEGIAVPFRSVFFEEKSGRMQARIGQDFSDAMLDFIADRD